MRKAEGRKRFRFYKHRFPLAARHDFGDGFGAGRGHQGIDIFAKCGKKIRAARGGRVQVRASHSSAGKYLVIDGHGTGQDYAYMHMRGAGRPAEGSRVRTGEVIGRNSDTGNASGCHLHFEIWSSPGWYEGGRAIRPDKRVRRWDGWS
jgi:murein DD-endopeptidase MepM/ murein hydrolase activator NlpD